MVSRRLLRIALAALLGVLLWPGHALAALDLHLPVWTVAPFILLLLAIAILPLVAGHFWHSNRNRLLVTAVIALPTVGYLAYHHVTTGEDALGALGHVMIEYLAFIALLGALFVVAGGVVLRGDLLPRPAVNTSFLAIGAVLANFVGTTGASMLLIRPVLRINRHRTHVRHLPIFFIFTVSNLGGLLTPLGDPPLFLGFLRGVPFFWTLNLWPEWVVANAIVLTMFFLWDSLAFAREAPEARSAERLGNDRLDLIGKHNFIFLAGVIACVLVGGQLAEPWNHVVGIGGPAVMLLLSWLFTARSLRLANGFTWAPILEVAILFAGIFVTMVPTLAILAENRDAFDIDQPWQFFWLTGSLSAFLDNAPTYVTFATLAAGGRDFAGLAANEVPGIDGPAILAAISCGAVFMGAMTYIGNGPNFMVKAIADEAGYKTPSFFGYLAYSCVLLLPVFGIVTWLFFL